MKKTVIVGLCLALIWIMAIPCFATGGALSLIDAAGEPGETVYLTVMLNESAVGDTMGITYEYDSDVLTAVTSANSWAPEGLLQDFNKENAGVWAADKAQDLKGSLCVLAFRVAEGVSFTKTEVSCKVIIKNGSTEVGIFSAVGAITMECDHNFGPWEDKGSVGHSHICQKCQFAQTKSHSWDQGTTTEKTDEPNVIVVTYTCEICGATKQMEYQNGEKPVEKETTRPTENKDVTKPTIYTKPTEPTTKPTQPMITPVQQTEPEETTYPTVPSAPKDKGTEPTKPYHDYNEPEDSTDEDHSGHNHGQEGQSRLPNNGGDPIVITPEGTHNTGEEVIQGSDSELHVHATNGETDGHTHSEDFSAAAVIGAVGVLVLAVCAAVLYLKKKR